MKRVLRIRKTSAFRKQETLFGAAALLAVGLSVFAPECAVADEGGVGFWFPGQFGSLAAVPQVPGWAFGIINVYENVSASGNVAAAREVTLGNLHPNVNVNLNVNIGARPDLVLVAPTYAFATPVLGGQLALTMAGAGGRSSGDLNGTLTVSALGMTAMRQGAISDARYGFTDLYPEASLKWNSGVNNWMIYGIGDIPVGTYDSSRLANFGIGHGALDGGVGYTYFDPKTGHEFSVVTGLSYNLMNPSTGYQNGVDWHVDWGLSQFVTKTVQIGAVGYFYQQLTADRGAAAFLGENLSRVAAIGPQFGFLFPAGSMQGYLNLKGYWEFDAQNRASGWNAWVTLAFSPTPAPTTASHPLITK